MENDDLDAERAQQLKNGRSQLEIGRDVAGFVGGAMAHAMLGAAKEKICPEIKK